MGEALYRENGDRRSADDIERTLVGRSYRRSQMNTSRDVTMPTIITPLDDVGSVRVSKTMIDRRRTVGLV